MARDLVSLLMRLPSLVLIGLTRGYQLLVSPLLGRHCRFEPSCSEYAKAAVQKYGSLAGVARSLKRIFKCHPLHSGGFDPVE